MSSSALYFLHAMGINKTTRERMKEWKVRKQIVSRFGAERNKWLNLTEQLRLGMGVFIYATLLSLFYYSALLFSFLYLLFLFYLCPIKNI